MPKVQDILAESAEKWPDRPALVEKQGAVNYRTLAGRVEAARRRLRELGVGPGQGVGVLAPDGSDFIAAAFAAVGCGAVVVPLFHRSSRAELRRCLISPPLHAVLDGGAGIPPAEGSVFPLEIAGLLPLRLVRTAASGDAAYAPHVPDAAFVRFTSGTTGSSKGVILSHQAVYDRGAAANRGLELSSSDVVLSVLPMAFHFFVSIVLYLRQGATIIAGADLSPSELLEVANRHRVTFLYASPRHYRALAEDTSGQTLPDSVRLLLSTSTSLPLSVAQAFHKRYGRHVSQAYGIIEAGLPLVNLDSPGERPESVGRPLPDYEIALLDAGGRAVPAGETGELVVRGPGMFSGYLDPPRLREEIMRDGWFHTGDLAKRDAEGYVRIVGRRQSVIELESGAVHPEEIESLLGSHPGVLKSRVSARRVARPGKDGAPRVVLHADVVPRDPGHPPAPEELLALCRSRFSAAHALGSISIVSEIPETASGKVARR